MQFDVFIKRRKGSTMLIVGAVIMALFLFFGGFIKYATSRRYTTGKLNKNYLARDLSYSIALLAAHHLKEVEIRNKDGNLYKQLSLPINQMNEELSENIEFEPALASIMTKLIKGSTGLEELACQVGWRLKKSDFEPLIEAFPREKKGKIYIPVTMTFRVPGISDPVNENYLYSVDLKVTANIIPILSRFSLYIADARCGDSEDRFNLVNSDMYGNLKNSDYRPWVIDNGNSGVANFPSRFSEIIDSPVGLVYLGGGKVVLGVSRGWNIPGQYAEGFHLMAEGRGDGIYTTGFIGNMGLLNWETGLCNDLSDDSARFWWELIKDGYDDLSRRNSIFRLMGTDQNRSPTLVFGDVYGRTLCAKAFKEGNDFYGPLPYVNNQARFEDICSGGSEDFDIGYFKSVVGNISRSEYNSEYASSLLEVPYNRSLSYIITNHNNPKPMNSGIIPVSDPLYDFIEGKAVTKGFADKIPEPYASMYSDISNLNNMKKILSKIGVPGERAIRSLELKIDENLVERLAIEGFLKDGKLDINGWLHIKSNKEIVLENSLELLSHGGIVVEGADIIIENTVKGGADNFLLHLVALNGNIDVDSSVGGELSVSLIAAGDSSDKGQVRFKGDINSNLPIIKGNLAMAKLNKSNFAQNVSRGVEVKYSPELSALPGKISEEMSEKALLMFGIETKPELLE